MGHQGGLGCCRRRSQTERHANNHVLPPRINRTFCGCSGFCRVAILYLPPTQRHGHRNAAWVHSLRRYRHACMGCHGSDRILAHVVVIIFSYLGLQPFSAGHIRSSAWRGTCVFCGCAARSVFGSLCPKRSAEPRSCCDSCRYCGPEFTQVQSVSHRCTSRGGSRRFFLWRTRSSTNRSLRSGFSAFCRVRRSQSLVLLCALASVRQSSRGLIAQDEQSEWFP
mmetsp:Transcript_14792/g.31718  ORF Transcript_14792/g.31718 Transcript_14792/m.31718 type:complete len:223 (-) Transcript_14792:1913-2581(-)